MMRRWTKTESKLKMSDRTEKKRPEEIRIRCSNTFILVRLCFFMHHNNISFEMCSCTCLCVCVFLSTAAPLVHLVGYIVYRFSDLAKCVYLFIPWLLLHMASFSHVVQRRGLDECDARSQRRVKTQTENHTFNVHLICAHPSICMCICCVRVLLLFHLSFVPFFRSIMIYSFENARFQNKKHKKNYIWIWRKYTDADSRRDRTTEHKKQSNTIKQEWRGKCRNKKMRTKRNL